MRYPENFPGPRRIGQETLGFRRSIAFAKGVSALNKSRLTAIALMIILTFSPVALAKDYIEVWPEGWSDVTPLFKTSIFADRFFTVHDSAGTSFLSVDGVYFKELDLTYRMVQDRVVKEKVVLRSKTEIESAYLGLDQNGRRHVVWLERSAERNSINHTSFDAPYQGHEAKSLLETDHTIQDLSAFQDGKATHAVWSEREGYFQIKYAKIEDGELATLETVTNTSELSVRPSVTVDSHGTPHIVWVESTPIGIEIHYSKKMAESWSKPRKVGAGSVQDVQLGGSISLASFDDELYIAWATLPSNSNRLFVYLVKLDAQGEMTSPAPFALGSKAQFVVGTEQPELVWQGVGPFGAQINHADLHGGPTNLTVGRKGAFRPESFSIGHFRYVYWLQAHPDGGYEVFEINNQYPKVISVWRKMGLDESAPFYHLIFLFVSTLMLAAVYTVLNMGVMLAGGAIYSLLQRFGAYHKQPLFYQVALMATILVVFRRLPIPAGNPEFFGLIHYGLSYAIATLGTFLILRKVRQRGFFLTVSICLIWMFLYQFFALIPQNILR